MKPKEKAHELFSKYSYLSESHIPTLGVKVAKQCALIAVDEILESDWFIPTKEDKINWNNYWKEVKQEIEKL